jgi:predicted nucleic acid-binding protein
MRDDFIDSNVILYSFDTRDGRYDEASRLVEESVLTSACISFQVVQEVINVLTRDLERPGLEQLVDLALQDILKPMWRIMPSSDLYIHAFAIRNRYRYAFYDSLIIAAALDANCTRLYSEDLQHGQRIERLTIINPFL